MTSIADVPADCTSDLTFDLLLAGDLSEANERSVRKHAEQCARCHDRLGELERHREECAAAYPLESMPVARPAVGPQRRGRSAARVSLAALVVAAAVVLIVVRSPEDRGGRPSGDTRSKGAGYLTMYVQHGGAVRVGATGERVSPGDVLQFTYTIPAPRFLAVLSLDAAGHASVYFPDDQTTAWRAAPGTDVALPRSTTLDQSEGHETLFLLVCSEAVALEPIRAAVLASAEQPDLPASCQASRLEIEKRGPA